LSYFYSIQFVVFNTLVQAFEEEGKNAIDLPGMAMPFEISPDEYDLGEEVCVSLLKMTQYF